MSEIRGLLLVSGGVATLIFYWSWWFKEGRLFSPFLFGLFLFALSYGLFQVFGNWLIYLATHRRFVRPSRRKFVNHYMVDVFVTACGEDSSMVERAMAACLKMNGRFKVWLLDDGDDPALALLAQKHHVGYLNRVGNEGFKAGNINAALQKTSAEIVAIFDVDHAPKPDFLEKTVGYFTNPNVGFVQAMLTFENQKDGWVATAASESSLDFYNPTSIGTDGLWSATLVGSNAVIRRSALESVSGYKPGLAEDLATSISMHAEGWQSVYVEEPLAPGLAPPDLTAWFTQQLKWSRGVFEIFITDYFRLMRRLTRGKIAAYGVRMTYYWIGIVTFLHIAITVSLLLTQNKSGLDTFQEYLFHLFPLVFMTLFIRQMAFRKWRHPLTKKQVQWRAILLVFSTWPIYTLSWTMAVLRVPLNFRPTPKAKSGGLHIGWLMPQMVAVFLLLFGSLALIVESGTTYLFVLIFAFILLLPQLLLLIKRFVFQNKAVSSRIVSRAESLFTD